MPEKVRVSPAAASQLSTGSGQAALVPEDDVEDEDDVLDELLDDESDDLAADEDEDDDSDFAGVALLPDERLSVR